MRARNVRLPDLCDFDPDGGVMTFAGERVLLMDAVAMGILRATLLRAFGMTGPRSILTRFGYSHGYRLALAMKTAIPWDDDREWRVAGGRLHRLHGMVIFEPVTKSTHDPAPSKRRAPEADEEQGLVVRSETMKRLLAQARRVAGVDTTVLLHGESGTGKERLARLIHEASPRQAGPFVAIDCAAVPEALLESELFGHARGSFTGATNERIGLFEAAKGAVHREAEPPCAEFNGARTDNAGYGPHERSYGACGSGRGRDAAVAEARRRAVRVAAHGADLRGAVA